MKKSIPTGMLFIMPYELLMLFDILADITNGGHLHCFFVGDGNAEVFFQIHHQLNDVQRVSVQVFLNLGVHGHGSCISVKLFCQKLANFLNPRRPGRPGCRPR